MEKKKKKIVDTNLGILLICLFSSIFTMADFIIIDNVLDKYIDYSKCECQKCNSNLNSDGVIDNKKDDDNKVYKDNNVIDSDLKNDIEEIMEKYYTTVYFSKKCGEKDFDDIYYPNNDGFDYVRCLEYNSIAEIERYYDSFMSEDFYSEIVDSSFVENDNKLYCRAHHTAPYTYVDGSFEVSFVQKDGDGIIVKGIYRTEDNGLYPSCTFDVSLSLVYNNGNLVLNNYDEKMREI